MKIPFLFIVIFSTCTKSYASPANDSCYAYYIKARAYLQAGKNAEALFFLDSCVRNGCNGTAFYNLCGCAVMTLTVVNDDAHNLQAIRFFSTAIARDSSTPLLYNNRGWAFQNLNKTKYTEALKDFRKAAALDSSDVDLHGNVLRVLWLMNRNREAYAYADKMVLLFPRDGYAYYVRGNLKRDYLHKYPEGNADIKRSEELKWKEGMHLRY